MQKYKNLLPTLLLSFPLMAVYLVCMAPGLTWAHFGADGGDLITAAATGGVAHPSGYPTYLLLARLFQSLPFGALAYRTNLLSALAMTAASVFIYALVSRRLRGDNPFFIHLSGLAAGFAFGLAPLAWSQAVITEVYALHNLFVALLLYLCFAENPSGPTAGRPDWLIGLTFGLGLGNHSTLFLLFPIVFALSFRNWRVRTHSISLRLWGLIAGLMIYLVLPVRALSAAPVNWGNAATLDGFLWLISGQLYRGQVFALSGGDLLERVSALAALLWGQFGLTGLLLGLYGAFNGRLSDLLQRSLVWIVFASAALALGYATSDSFLYLLPAILCFSIWIGIGLHGLLAGLLPRWGRVAQLAGLSFFVILFIQAGMNWAQVDASADLRAEEFGEQVLSTVPAEALLFAEGDQAIFALWYFHFSLGQRPDLAIVATDLLHFPWYLESLQNAYPELKIPGPYPFAQALTVANPDRPTCTVRYERWTQLYCQPAVGSDE